MKEGGGGGVAWGVWKVGGREDGGRGGWGGNGGCVVYGQVCICTPPHGHLVTSGTALVVTFTLWNQ